MSLTNPTIHVPEAQVSVPSWVRRHLSWMLVALAVLATVAVLAVTLVDSDSGTDIAPVTDTFDADRGSINAVERRAAVGVGDGDGDTAGPAGSVRHDSISAIDHRTAVQGR